MPNTNNHRRLASAGAIAPAKSGTHKPIRVVFLLFYFEAWDSLAGVYETMRNDSRFAPTIVSMPRKLTGDDAYGGEVAVHAFLSKLGLPHIRLRSDDHKANVSKLKTLEPDYVFLNYPWQRNYPPEFRPDQLAKFTRIAYVPYFLLPLVDEAPASGSPAQSAVASHLYEQRTHQLASLVFTQDEEARAAFATTSRGNQHVFVTGNPKLDALKAKADKASAKRSAKIQARSARNKPASKYRLKVLWAPHHSYSTAWLAFGRFAKDYEDMLRFAYANPSVKVTLRPHPFLFGTLADRRVISQSALDSWLSEWKALPNTRITTKSSFAKQFAMHDLLLTDGISFLAEYPLLTGKPAIFIENPEHWSFNSIGEVAARCNIRVTNVMQFEQLISGLDSDQDLLSVLTVDEASVVLDAIVELRRLADPASGASSIKIAETVAQDFAKQPPFVNPGDIKEIAWEDRPGREPRTD